MDEIKANLVALVEADAENARTRAQRLRMLAKFIVGDEKQMLMQANLEEGSAKTYEAIAPRMRRKLGSPQRVRVYAKKGSGSAALPRENQPRPHPFPRARENFTDPCSYVFVRLAPAPAPVAVQTLR